MAAVLKPDPETAGEVPLLAMVQQRQYCQRDAVQQETVVGTVVLRLVGQLAQSGQASHPGSGLILEQGVQAEGLERPVQAVELTREWSKQN